MKGASPGIIVLKAEWRENPATKEYDLYVLDWELVEGTITPMPSNAGALQLKVYDQLNNEVKEGDILCHIQKLSVNINPKNNDMDKPEIKLSAEALVKLELKDGSSADVVNTAIIKLAADCAEAKDKITLLQGEIDKHKRDAAERMVELALEEQKITPANKQSFIDLALKDPELCKSTLDGIRSEERRVGKECRL